VPDGTRTIEDRVAALESEVVNINESIQGIPDAVLDKVAAGLAEVVGPQIHQLMLMESGSIVATGCKQLAAGAARGTYETGKKVVVAPVKAARWGYEKLVGAFGYKFADDEEVVEAPAEAAPATA